MRRVLACWLLLVLGLCLPTLVDGQGIAYHRVERKPEVAGEGDLWHEPRFGSLFQYKAGQWELVCVEQVDSVVSCSGHFVIYKHGGDMLLMNPKGRRNSTTNMVAACGPNGLLYKGDAYWSLIDRKGTLKDLVPTYNRNYQGDIHAMYLDGRIVYSSWVGDSAAKSAVLMRGASPVGFGLKDLQGNWVIEPIYDAPFFFKNGRATVEYYGVSFEIDEHGKRIE